MARSHMGSLLKSRREELGISLDMAATATNVRARMLAVLEAGDFQKFPPYGHSMTMIASYARYLQLDPHAILQEFETEWAEFDSSRDMARTAERARRGLGRYDEPAASSARPSQRTERARSASRASGSIRSKLSDERAAEEDDRYKSGSVKVVGRRQTGAFRHVEPRGTRSELPSSPLAAAHTGSSDRPGSSGSTAARSKFSRATHAPSETGAQASKPDFFSPEALDRRTAASTGVAARTRSRQRTRQTSQDNDDSIVSRISSLVREAFSERRTRIIVCAAAVFVIVIALLAGILISTAGNGGDGGVIAVQGGASDNTETKNTGSGATATVTTTNGNPVNVAISVGELQTSIVTISYDGDTYRRSVVGPWQQEFLVTESFDATFDNPDAVSVTENGYPISIEKDDNGEGRISLVVETTSTNTSTTSSADLSSEESGKADKKSSGSSSESGSSSN